jgi:hypothetical protein
VAVFGEPNSSEEFGDTATFLGLSFIFLFFEDELHICSRRSHLTYHGFKSPAANLEFVTPPIYFPWFVHINAARILRPSFF